MTDGETFTVASAEAVLPWLAEVLPRIRETRQVILAGARRVRANAPRNGATDPGQEYWDALTALRRDVVALADRGVVLRDPETGLVDFPSTRDGREIFLCWRLGEEHVAFWHGPESGFGGRRPV